MYAIHRGLRTPGICSVKMHTPSIGCMRTWSRSMANNDFTKVPNYFFEHMADMDKCEQSVVLLVIRKTIGYQKEWDRISFSQFMSEAGLERASVDKGIKAALERGIVERRETKNSFEYRLCEPQIGSKNEPFFKDNAIENGSKNEPKIENGSENEPKSVQKMNTQKKKENKNNIDDDEAQSKWFSALCWLVYGHQDYKLLSKTDCIAVGKTAKQLRELNYTIDELREWYRDKWSIEWPGKQQGKAEIQKPSLKQIKTGIGQVKAKAIHVNGFGQDTAVNKSISVVRELER